MKKIFTLLLSLIITISSFAVLPLSAYADSKQHIETALETLQTKSGYIPGSTAAVTGNCFGFACAVCQNLYGVTYYYEQMNGSYQYTHTSNYKTVGAQAFSAPSTTDEQKTIAAQIKNFVINNAAPGDVISYGCANNSTTHKHTAIIQHIDCEKMLVFHSNYACGNYDASDCHVDTIYWKSFLANPNTNTYDSNGNVVSLNKFFGAPMCCSNGVGISINRYAKLTDSYYLDTAVLSSPTVSTERKSCTSINFSWTSVDNATSYVYSLQNSAGKKICSNKSTSDTSVTISSLTCGEKYTFSLYAKNDTQTSATITKTITAKPPAPSSPSVSTDQSGINTSWTTRSDISGYQVFRSATKSGSYSLVGTITDKKNNSFSDKSITANTDYYYKIRRYLTDGSTVYYSDYSSSSSSIKNELYVPTTVTTTRTSSTAIRLNWSSVPCASKYFVKYKIKGGKWKTVSTSSLKYTFSNLKIGKKYYFKICSANDFGTSSYSSAYSKTALPPTPSSVVAKRLSSKTVKLTCSKSSGFTGYYIVRATNKSFTKNVKKKKVKSSLALCYKDKTAKSSTKYYYKICRYKGSVYGAYSKIVSI